jgi:high affinity Mn2+ porin
VGDRRADAVGQTREAPPLDTAVMQLRYTRQMYALRVWRQVLESLVRCAGLGRPTLPTNAGTSAACEERDIRRRVPGVTCATLVTAIVALAPSPAFPQSASPPPRTDEQFSLMRVLDEHGLHDTENESWNAYGQFTYISSWKPEFPARYTNANGSVNSLLPRKERSFTGTVTLYFGVRLWTGAEAYVAPEIIAEQPFSQLRGLGGAIQNFELQKGGTAAPQIYRSRAYLRQSIGLGGERAKQESSPLQLGTAYQRRRLVFSVGNFSVLDFFDKNAFDIDPRQGFLSLSFLTYPSYDFASDARGYSWGGVAELFWDDWAVRVARITPPREPNQLPVDFRLATHYGDQLELEHRHHVAGQDGIIRVLAYRNREDIGRFSDAIAAFEADPAKSATTCPEFNYGSDNASAPDLCWARRPNTKVGVGVFAQQYLTRDIGVFSRAMASDGQTEVDAYTSTDRSATFGVLAKGGAWSRSGDLAGVGLNLGWISPIHAEYLRLGGIDGFIGDGSIRPGAERAWDLFYSVNVAKSLWLSGDYQHITNPAFNADRGPVNVFSARIHAEF